MEVRKKMHIIFIENEENVIVKVRQSLKSCLHISPHMKDDEEERNE